MAFNDSSRRPRLVEGIELRLLPLSPQEAFVLSRVDGTVSESELVMLTGLDADVVRDALTRLASLGALAFVEPSRASPANALGQSGVRISRPSGTLRIGPIVEVRAGHDEPHHPAAALYDPAELDEAVELDVARKRRVLDAFYRLDSITHYELLKVPQQADKKAIKAAYYELVQIFHPDRYYGKNLGSFKHKLERVFARITEAHDVLTRNQAREEYDLYLKAQERTRALDQTLHDMQGSALEVERIEREIREQARAAEHAQSQYPPVETTFRASVVPTSPSPVPVPLQPRQSDPESRRRALARKLGMSVPPGARSSSGSGERPVVPSERPSDRGAISTRETREAAADELKRRYEQRVTELKRRQVDTYVHSAERSLQSKDLISAANAMKIAVSLAPGDIRLRERLDEIQLQAALTLATSYLEQAEYEEREGRFAEAARSYERVARAKASPKVFERTAYCLLSARGDLKVAAEWGKRAVQGAPEDAGFRVTLARIYLEAGLRQSAVAEFERAATLSPKDDTIKDWLRKARRTDG